MDTPIKAALVYLGYGWSVIPVGLDKRPIGEWKPQQTVRMTPNEVQLRFSDSRVNGVAVVCGQVSGLQVLDFDGVAGLESLQALESLIPTTTPRVRTGSGGIHLYFRLDPAQRIKVWFWRGEKAGELRGEGGFVVAPPSVHPSGNLYCWLVEPSFPLSPMSAALREAIFPSTASNGLQRPKEAMAREGQVGELWLERAITRAKTGSRNSTGFWLACQLRDGGLTKTQAESLIYNYAQAVADLGSHPYRMAEALASLDQAYNRSPRSSQGSTTYSTRVLGRFRRLP